MDNIKEFVLQGENGISIKILNIGGIIKEVITPDKNGNLKNIVLNYSNNEEYYTNPNYFGSIIGRTAGRIGDGKFSINGKEIILEKNNGNNNLHGGSSDLSKKIWDVLDYNQNSLLLTTVSEDGEGGYPGNVKFILQYTLLGKCLKLKLTATSDKTTYINITNHSYFNLNSKDGKDIKNHFIKGRFKFYSSLDENNIPIEWIPIENTAFDFGTPKLLGKIIDSKDSQIKLCRGLDHPFKIDETMADLDVVSIFEKESGRILRIYTNQREMVIYTGNFLENNHSGVCFEAQEIPNGPNLKFHKANFLEPWNQYNLEIVYEFNVCKDGEIK